MNLERNTKSTISNSESLPNYLHLLRGHEWTTQADEQLMLQALEAEDQGKDQLRFVCIFRMLDGLIGVLLAY